MSPGAILLAGISAALFFGALMAARYGITRLRDHMRRMDDARERRIAATREADRRQRQEQ